MISMSAIGSAAGAASYYTTEQAKIEYYAGEVVPSVWGGKGAEINGLAGHVEASDLSRVLAGHVNEVGPAGDVQRVQLGRTVIDPETGQKTTEHRAGWDMTFAPPKSVSIESEIYGQTGVRDAHEAAVQAGMKWLEADGAQTRVNGRFVGTGNLTYASFSHATSRAGDPHTHTHVLVANVTYHEGKAYSLSNEKMMQLRTTVDAVYLNELASQLREQGYLLRYDGRGEFEIAGYSRAHVEEFSKRTDERDAALESRGIDKDSASYEARQAAVLATRVDKAEGHSESAEAHRDRWQAEAGAAGIQPAERNAGLAAELPGAREIVRGAVASLAEREQEFSRKDLVKESMLQSSGRASSAELVAAIDAAAHKGELVQRDPDRAGARYTTHGAIAGERWADNTITAGRDAHTAIMSGAEFRASLGAFERRKGFELKDEQRDAASQILTGRDQFSGVQGAAGTGKTTMLEFVREAAESKGWTVQGFSTGAAQAEKLQADSKIESGTTASFLAKAKAEQGAATGQAKILYVNDEASMAGQKEFNGVIDATVRAGAKTVFVGDKAQHQSVSAGGAFERAQPHMSMSELKQISRQKTEEARAPVRSILEGNYGDAIRHTAIESSSARAAVEAKWKAVEQQADQALTKAQVQQRRDEIKAARQIDNQSAIKAIAADYAALTPDERAKTVVVTATNDDRRALNLAIRAELKAAGGLSAETVQVGTLRQKDLTRAQGGHASSYQPGDVLKQTGKDGSVSYLTVRGIDAQANRLVVEGESRETQRIDAKQAGRMQAYTADVREFASGDRIAFLENDRSTGIKNGHAGTFIASDGGRMTVLLDNGSRKEIDLSRYKQMDHGYVLTSHKAQGETVSRALVHHNTDAGRHGQRETYVNTTRHQHVVKTYTQDRELAAQQASKAVDKSVANPHAKAKDMQAAPTSQRQAHGEGLGLRHATYADYRPSRPDATKERTINHTSTKATEVKPAQQERTQERSRNNGIELTRD
ncbi:MobF family relaxase [Paraburkholderia sediminicola]|uniref:MobF family relaxase n=1 Tax=Paraburkholderia sediminicola TaxID=458836 RepID=UPI0038B7017A